MQHLLKNVLLPSLLLIFCAGLATTSDQAAKTKESSVKSRMDNEKVIQMVQLGLSDEIIKNAIDDTSERAFDFSSKSRAELKAAGVSNGVIDHMALSVKSRVESETAVNNKQTSPSNLLTSVRTPDVLPAAKEFKGIKCSRCGFLVKNPDNKYCPHCWALLKRRQTPGEK